MKQIRYLLLLAFVWHTQFVAAQENSPNQVIENLVEEIAANADEDLDYTTLIEDLEYFFVNPINLNTATESEFEKLHFLNELQIKNLVNYRKRRGSFLTIYELQVIDGFSQKDIKQLLPFVSVQISSKREKLSLKRAFKYGRQQVFLRAERYVEKKAGYLVSAEEIAENPTKNRYLGNPWKYYARYKFNFQNRLQFGITAEKDNGEEFFTGSQKNGFDYYSAHLQVNDIGIFKKILLGDYQLQLGQGLAFWSGMGVGKSSYVMSVRKKGQGIKKYSSVDENKFLRGAAATVTIGDLEFTGFFSQKNIDGNIDNNSEIDNSEIRYATSLQSSGYHRTFSEIADKHAIKETIYGVAANFRYKQLKVGASAIHYTFDPGLGKELKPYNQFDFQGNSNSNFSLDYQYFVGKMQFFGEVGMSANQSIATVNGLLIALAPQVTMSVLHRYYSPDYQAYYSETFSENSHPQNENGLYLGIEIYPIRRWKLSAYFDTYRFDWLKYRVDAPSQGYDYLAQLDYSPSRHVDMYWRVKQEVKPQNISFDAATVEPSGVKPIVDVDKLLFRYHLSYRVSRNITLRNRLEISRYRKGTTTKHGYMLYQDINFKPQNFPLSISFRYAIFDAPYDARIYAYENDVLYAFSIPAYFYKGVRTYVTAKYKISKRIDIWLRWAQSYYIDRESIGTGLDEIAGNRRNRIKLQVRFKF